MEMHTVSEKLMKLEELRKQAKPTTIWKDFMDNDDELGIFYTTEGISDVSFTIDKFIDRIKANLENLNEDIIMSIVKDLVLELNELSHKHSGMIETMEREDLAEFIFSVLDIIEFEYEDDITEQWREW